MSAMVRMIATALLLLCCSFAHTQTQQLSPAEWTSVLIQGCKLAVQSPSKDDDSPTGILNKGSCIGYISGFVDAAEMYTSFLRLPFCIPEGVTTGQLIKVFVKYTDDHPEKLHYDSAMLVSASLHNAFPCPK